MKGQILIIDDNPMDIKIVSASLEKSGYACIGFNEAAKAVQWLTENRPKLIFLDLVMPEITGYELIPEIRKNKNLQNTPIIITSGKNQAEDVKKAILLGANDYVVKPLDPLVIQEKISKLDASSPSEEFHSVYVGDQPFTNANFSIPFKIRNINEFGFEVNSAFKINTGETIAAENLSIDIFGIKNILIRCLNSEPTADNKEHKMQFTFVGLTEVQRQTIRKSCRQIWLQNKK